MEWIYAVVNISDMTGRWDDVIQTESYAIKDKEDVPTKVIIKWAPGNEPSWFAALGVPSYATPARLHAALVIQDIWTTDEE